MVVECYCPWDAIFKYKDKKIVIVKCGDFAGRKQISMRRFDLRSVASVSCDVSEAMGDRRLRIFGVMMPAFFGAQHTRNGPWLCVPKRLERGDSLWYGL